MDQTIYAAWVPPIFSEHFTRLYSSEDHILESNINGTYILSLGVGQAGKTKGQPPDPNRDPVGQK